jgi:hypothetical protein
MAGSRERSTSPALWLSWAMVGVLVVVVGTLTFFALQRDDGGVSASETPRPIPTFSIGGARATPTPTPTATAVADTAPGPDERFLSAGTDALWRATAGACHGTGPLLERSTDAGRTWDDVTPRYRGIARIASLDAFAGSEAEMIASMGAGCETQAMRTFTEGQFWESYPNVLSTSTYLDPKSPASLVVPGGRVDAPCATPSGLRVSSDPSAVALLCDGGAYLLSSDRKWNALDVPNAVALAIGPSGVVVGHAATGCDGLALTTVALSGSAEGSIRCVGDADPGQPIALTESPDGVLVWTGDRIVTAD